MFSSIPHTFGSRHACVYGRIKPKCACQARIYACQTVCIFKPHCMQYQIPNNLQKWHFGPSFCHVGAKIVSHKTLLKCSLLFCFQAALKHPQTTTSIKAGERQIRPEISKFTRVRGCSLMTSLYFGPFWTSPSPHVTKNHFLEDPPVPPQKVTSLINER